MQGPKDLRRMEEFWLTRGEWGLVISLEGLAVLCLVAGVVLAGLGVVALVGPPDEASAGDGTEGLFALMALPMFAAAVGCVGWAVVLFVAATVLRFRGSFRLMVHQQIPVAGAGASMPIFGPRV